MTKEIEEKVLIALDEIRPFLEKDGGDISLESISEFKVNSISLGSSKGVFLTNPKKFYFFL